MKEKKLIVFNLAGALLMSTDEVIKIWCDAIRSIGKIPNYTKIFNHYDESFQEVIIPELAKEANWTKLEIDAIFNYAKKVFHDINTSTNSNLSEKLSKLKKSGYSLGVTTDKNFNTLIKGLNNIGCSSDLFNFISTSDDGFKKPDSRVLHKMLKKYRPEEMIFVGNDYHRDTPLTKAVGVEFVAISSIKFPVSFWKSMHEKPENVFTSVPEFIDFFLSK